MTGAYAYTPAIWSPLVAAILMATLAIYGWRRRGVAGALSLVAGSLFGILWSLGIAAGAASAAPDTRIAWHKFQAVWQLPAVTAMTCFALEYAFQGRWLTRRNLTLLSLPPLLLLLFIVIGDSQLMWRGLGVGPDGAILVSYATPGMVMVIYGLGLVLINLTAFLWLFINSPQHRWPVALMVVGQVAGRGLFLVNLWNPKLVSPLDPLILAFLVPLGMYAIALFGFHIFDPLPFARQTVIEQMREGMVVCDNRWRVLSLNPVAERILGVPAGRARGKSLEQILPAAPDPSEYLARGDAGPIEISLGNGPGARHYALNYTPLKDHRAVTIGHLLLLYEVTERRRVQVQLILQRTALATLTERDRLARELHDGLGQVLGYVKMQAEAARCALEQDDRARVDADLNRIASAAQDAHDDIRGFLLGVQGDRLRAQGFRASLLEVVQRFNRTYDMTTDVRWPEDLREDAIEPQAQAQLLRIIQESLSNIRRHAGTRSVTISLAVDQAALQIVVHDDGRGFDPALAGTGQDEIAGHYGLRFMRERAEGLGGSVDVTSSPGKGTDVLISVPLRERNHHDASAVG